MYPLKTSKLKSGNISSVRKYREVIPVTVCVATICDNATIFGASDRMLTSGDIQFEPPYPKIYDLTNSITAMVSGDMALQAELFSDLLQDIRAKVKSVGPSDWLSVKDVAYSYADIFSKLRANRAERDYLLPVNLTIETFISRQKELSDDLVNKLAKELVNYELPSSSVIFAGIDQYGPHLFVVSDGEVTCQDAVGFAAIGVGAYHAESHLMFSRYARNQSLSRALYLTFAAKKRAEVAPGVGSETDMFTIGPMLGSYTSISQSIVSDLQKMYIESDKRHKRADKKAEGKVHEYIAEIVERAKAQQEQTATKIEDGKASTNEENKT